MNISSTTFFKLDKTAHFHTLKPIRPEAKELKASGPLDNLLPTQPVKPTKIKVATNATKLDATNGELPITPLYPNPVSQVRSLIAQMRGLADKAASGADDASLEQLNKQFQKLFGDMMGMLKRGSISAQSLSAAGDTQNPMQKIIALLQENGLLGGKRPNILSEGDAKQAYSSLGMVLFSIDSMKPDFTASPGPIFPVDKTAEATPTVAPYNPDLPIIPLYPNPNTPKWPTATAGEEVKAELIPGSPGNIDNARTKQILNLFAAPSSAALPAESVKLDV